MYNNINDRQLLTVYHVKIMTKIYKIICDPKTISRKKLLIRGNLLGQNVT